MAKNAKDFEERPWGTFEVVWETKLADGSDVVVKKMTIKPQKRLSYQVHKFRTENSLVVQGQGYMILNGEKIPISTGSKMEVRVGDKHRVANEDEKINLIYIEISTGMFDEFDNTKLEDDFGRV